MIEEQTRTSISPSTKLRMTRSNCRGLICPWAISIRASGTSALIRSAAPWIVETRLCRKNACPPRSNSLSRASARI